ncbi:hypothetical protein H6787_02740 [Candidatus Nomurabacteria bacterium]|nr:hypothetical protein [Candidatus Nomurabacteria bacterium]
MFGFFNKPSRKKDLKAVKDFLIAHFQQIYSAKDRIPPDVFDVSMFFITEAIQLFDSIDILSRKNHLRGCLPIARTIMEISINLQYIYRKDVEQRAKLFKLDSMYEMRRKGDSIEDESKDNPVYQEYMKKLDEELKDYKKEKKTIYEKAAEVNMKSFYVSTYRRLSEYVHSGYRPARDFDEEGPYNDFLKRVVFTDTVMFMLMGLKSVCEEYDLDGGFMVIDDPGYKGIVFFSTNPKKEEERSKAYEESKKK